MKKLLIIALQQVKFNKIILGVLVILFCVSAFYPSDMEYYKNREKNDSIYVMAVEDGLRFVNTAAQIAIPILLADKIGMVQAVYVGIATTVLGQGLKRIFNDVHVGDTRLGERPSGGNYNMPSGHSAMAASAMAFVAIRYGAINLMYLLPLTILTMIARIMLKAHTLSATLSGLILGIIIGMLFSSKYTGDFKWKNPFKAFKKKE
ncbi:MAG: phosphatase PAP2 family protein [Alphaproteobacteria bacterium]|jgi:lipid A 1-phosphatase|nr:phosphatase PAP2 family protein [Alphaproteobacteria bacterium]